MLFHQITNRHDDLLLPWLDLYEEAFPQKERIPVSYHLAVARSLERGADPGSRLIAATDDQGSFVGLARYSFMQSLSAAYLSYLAIVEQGRGRGYGGRLYNHILRQVQEEMPDACALVFEVDLPQSSAEGEEEHISLRRIRFYQREQAKMLDGVDYAVAIGNMDAVPMGIMVHPIVELTPERAYEIAAGCLHGIGTIRRTTAPLRLI